MLRIANYLALGGSILMVACLAIAGTSNFARAQGPNRDAIGWQLPSQRSQTAEPDSRPPLDLAGCWKGAYTDTKLGAGDGYIYFVQDGRKLTSDTMAFLEFGSFQDGGSLSGKTNSKRFHLKFHKKQCNVSFHGKIDDSGDVVGKYHLSKKCTGGVLKGTFDLSFDTASGDCGGLNP